MALGSYPRLRLQAPGTLGLFWNIEQLSLWFLLLFTTTRLTVFPAVGVACLVVLATAAYHGAWMSFGGRRAPYKLTVAILKFLLWMLAATALMLGVVFWAAPEALTSPLLAGSHLRDAFRVSHSLYGHLQATNYPFALTAANTAAILMASTLGAAGITAVLLPPAFAQGEDLQAIMKRNAKTRSWLWWLSVAFAGIGLFAVSATFYSRGSYRRDWIDPSINGHGLLISAVLLASFVMWACGAQYVQAVLKLKSPLPEGQL